MRIVVGLAAALAGCGFEVPDGDGPGNVTAGPDAAERRDGDGDGFFDDADVCPNVVDPQQRDHDGDARGDACDVCPHRTDAGADQDLDGVGDACDPATGPPTRREQCKSGGWKRFDTPYRFRNQKRCILFVLTHD